MKNNISPLKRHILSRMLLAAVLLSSLLLLVFLTAYRSQLVGERSNASLGFNLLLQAALENAMLKRDVPGLADIVNRLGHQSGIEGVMILNPIGEVRFASSPDRIGAQLEGLLPKLDAPPQAAFTLSEEGVEVLRSINPVRNKQQCVVCHGPIAKHPINGILVVDYDAGEIRSHAWRSAAAFAAAGIGVLALIMIVLWRSLNKQVIVPVTALARASRDIEQGQLDRRVDIADGVRGELADLGACFNSMAQRLQAQMEQLQLQESYLQHILDALPDGVRVIRIRDKHVTLANRAFCQQVGKDAATIVERSCHLGSHGRNTPCVPTLVVCPLHELKQPGATLKTTHHHQRHDGSQFPAEVHAVHARLNTRDGADDYIIESVRDLGQQARISHEQRLSELGLLAAGIAHEIHNPLGSVRLGVQGLLREIDQGSCTPEQIRGYMDLIDQEIDNCIAVTRRLLLLARPPSGSLQLVTINDAMRDTLRLLEFDAQGRNIRQQSDLCQEPLRCLADEAEIRMLFLNLLQNAHHAMPQGGEVRVSMVRKGADAIIEIADNGVGMDNELVTRIFDPFFSRRADGVSGTGLGLTIVRNLIERMQGEISVDSEPAAGACFHLRLPLVDEGKDGVA